MYVKHNSKVGSHIEILELLTTFLLFRTGSQEDDIKVLLYFKIT